MSIRNRLETRFNVFYGLKQKWFFQGSAVIYQQVRDAYDVLTQQKHLRKQDKNSSERWKQKRKWTHEDEWMRNRKTYFYFGDTMSLTRF